MDINIGVKGLAIVADNAYDSITLIMLHRADAATTELFWQWTRFWGRFGVGEPGCFDAK